MEKKVWLYTDMPEYWGDLCEEIRLYEDVRKIEYASAKTVQSGGIFIRHTFLSREEWINIAEVFVDGNIKGMYEYRSGALKKGDALYYKKQKKRAAKIALFRALKAYYNKEIPWGSLTGVRPTKLMGDSIAEIGYENTKRLFLDTFDVSIDKIDLAADIVRRQDPIIKSIGKSDIDIYIGIPFCTTRCAYCSFLSGTVSKDGEIEKRYVDALLKEIEILKDMINLRKVRSVYVGGGTPTALNAGELRRVLAAARFGAKEFTVEAGRPDTITEEKLKIIKDAGADRISVNAQTTDDQTLKRIGRAHSAADFFKAYELTKKYNFKNINTDVIMGLPGEDGKTAKKTIQDVISLMPSNITVHTLAIKRASKFAGENMSVLPDRFRAQEMLDTCRAALKNAKYMPYYMYRQKYMAGNLENTGYAVSGSECIYNIDIMEEACSILAFGAGGISKRIFFRENRIERAPNTKDILHYINRVEEMAKRKLNLYECY